MKIHHWHVDREVIARTERALRVGDHEVFTIWTSVKPVTPQQGPLLVDGCIVPAQAPGASAGGVWVHIEGNELQRIQLENFQVGRRSVIQLHSHPGADVRMSELDRAWEVVRHVGALSIIVPFFGRGGLALTDGASVYEREEEDWRLWPANEVQERMVLV